MSNWTRYHAVFSWKCTVQPMSTVYVLRLHSSIDMHSLNSWRYWQYLRVNINMQWNAFDVALLEFQRTLTINWSFEQRCSNSVTSNSWFCYVFNAAHVVCQTDLLTIIILYITHENQWTVRKRQFGFWQLQKMNCSVWCSF